MRKLTRNFEQVCSEGTLPSMLMLVHGYSGVLFFLVRSFLLSIQYISFMLLIMNQVGKTLIVNEVHKPLAKSHGNYVSGKFDQFLSASPYSAVIQVCPPPLPTSATRSKIYDLHPRRH